MLLKPLANIVNHDVKLYVRKGGELVSILGFFAISLTLFPLAFGAENPLLQQYAPALIWIVALLSSLLSLPAIFHRDAQDGSLDQLRLSGVSLEWCVLGKCAANWFSCQLPLVLLSPLFAMLLGLSSEQGARLMLSLLIGTPVLSLIGALGSALTLHAHNKSGVLAVLVLPLYIPVLIFASLLAMTDPAKPALEFNETYIATALLLASLPLCCWAGAWLIRIQD